MNNKIEGLSYHGSVEKNLPAMQETWVRSLGWEDPLEKGIPTPVFLLGKFHGQRSLAGSSPWGRKELDMTEQLNNNNGVLWGEDGECVLKLDCEDD